MALDAATRAKLEGACNANTYRFPWTASDALVHVDTTPCPGSPGTPAWCINALGAVQLDLAAIYGDDTGKMERDIRRVVSHGAAQVPALWIGFLAHEFAHSQWSTWKHDDDAPATTRKIIELFEEIRIESRAADWKGADGVGHLRHSFKWLLQRLIEREISPRPMYLAHTWALIYGRYLASIAGKAEVETLDTAIRTTLGDDTVDFLGEILEEAVTTSSLRRVRELAEEWLDLVKTDEDDDEGCTVTLILHAEPEPEEGEAGEEGEKSDAKTEGKPGEGSAKGDEKDDKTDSAESGSGGDDDDANSEQDEELIEVLTAALQETADELNPDAKPPVITLERDILKTAAQVFNRSAYSSSWTEREPTGAQRAEAARLARTLENLALPSVTLTHTPAQLPPGRLRGREAVRQGAERSRGLMSTATPWRTSKRARSTTKPVIVATMTDTSGSMNWAEDFVADFAWMMSTAGARIGARTAAVTFGDRAEPVTRPNKIPQTIRVRTANGGSEAFDEAAAAIEGVLHLGMNTNSAKVLFLVTDGQLVISGEIERAARWFEKWTKAGVLIVWIGANEYHYQAITKRVQRPGRVVRIKASRYNNEKVIKQMEAEVIKAARGMDL